jgi:hypothetical protein
MPGRGSRVPARDINRGHPACGIRSASKSSMTFMLWWELLAASVVLRGKSMRSFQLGTYSVAGALVRRQTTKKLQKYERKAFAVQWKLNYYECLLGLAMCTTLTWQPQRLSLSCAPGRRVTPLAGWSFVRAERRRAPDSTVRSCDPHCTILQRSWYVLRRCDCFSYRWEFCGGRKLVCFHLRAFFSAP